MLIYIQTLTGVKHTFEVEESDTIQSLKDKIFEQEHIPIQQQRLIFKNKELDNKTTFADHGLSDESSIYLVVRMSQINQKDQLDEDEKEQISSVNQTLTVVEKIQFVVTIPNGDGNEQLMTMPINSTIKQVKQKLKEMRNIQDAIIFSCEGKTLSNKKTLADYGITNNSVLVYTLKFGGGR